MSSSSLREKEIVKAFHEVIKKSNGVIQSTIHQLLYSSSSFFLLLAAVLSLISLSIAWRKSKAFSQFTNGSFKSTILNVGGDILSAPSPTTKLPGSVAIFLNNPRTLSGSNEFQSLDNCRDGLCADSENRCTLTNSCWCGGFCETTAAGCRARVPPVNVDMQNLYELRCQNDLDAIQESIDEFNAYPPAWRNFFGQRTITINDVFGVVNANVSGCSTINDDCVTVSTFDKSLILVTDGQEWYFANFPQGLV